MASEIDSVVGASDAEAHFAEILDRVASGEEITITRDGIAVAQMSPVRKASTLEERQEAIRIMQEIASRHRLDGLKIKDLIEEGRK